jgi:hypothetical protein
MIMAPSSRRSAYLTLLALVGLAGLAGSAHAQDLNPYNTPVMSTPSPYWGYTYSPYASALHGVADVIRSQGQYLVNKEQATMMREKNRQEKITTRRKEVEHWVWEREFKAEAAKKERLRIQEEEREKSRTAPPLGEVLSAYSLNFLLQELKQKPGLSTNASTPVDSEWLLHIHVTYVTSGAGGNVGLLKGDQVPWALLLRSQPYRSQRERVEELLNRAKQEVRNGGATTDTLVELRKQLDSLEDRVHQDARSGRGDLWTPGDFIRASRSLREIKSAAHMLEDTDAAFYLDPLQGRTVAELVQFMKSKGLSFAPATAGAERFYIALHRALADEFNSQR